MHDGSSPRPANWLRKRRATAKLDRDEATIAISGVLRLGAAEVRIRPILIGGPQMLLSCSGYVHADRALGSARLRIAAPPSLPHRLSSAWLDMEQCHSTKQDLSKPSGLPPIWRAALSVHQSWCARNPSRHVAQHAALDHSEGLADQGHEAGEISRP